MHNGQPFRLDDGGPFSFREGVLYDGGVAVDELAAAAGTPRLPVCTRRCGGRVPATPERVPSRPGPLLRQGERQPRPAAAAGRHRGRVRRGQRGRAAPGPAGRWPPRPDRVRRGRQDRPGARRCRAFWGGAARRVGRRAGGLQAVAAGLGARVGSGCGSTRTWKPDSIPIFAPATTRPSSACRQAPRSSCIGGSWPATTPTSTRSGSMSTLVPSSPARATRPPGPGSRPACSKRAGGSGSPPPGGRRPRPPGRLRRRAGVAPGRVRRRPHVAGRRRWRRAQGRARPFPGRQDPGSDLAPGAHQALWG